MHTLITVCSRGLHGHQDDGNTAVMWTTLAESTAVTAATGTDSAVTPWQRGRVSAILPRQWYLIW